MSDGNSLDLPFEPTTGELLDEHVNYSGGVVVMASVVTLAEGKAPALVFRFAVPTGGFYPPTVLVLEDDQMAKLRPLIMEAIATARRGAKAS